MRRRSFSSPIEHPDLPAGQAFVMGQGQSQRAGIAERVPRPPVVDVVARDHPMSTHDTMHERRDVQEQHQIPTPLTWSATCRYHSMSSWTGLMVAQPKLVSPLEAPTNLPSAVHVRGSA